MTISYVATANFPFVNGRSSKIFKNYNFFFAIKKRKLQQPRIEPGMPCMLTALLHHYLIIKGTFLNDTCITGDPIPKSNLIANLA